MDLIYAEDLERKLSNLEADWETLSEEEKQFWDAIGDSASDKAERWFLKSVFERIDFTVRTLAESKGISLPDKDSILTNLEEGDIDSVMEVYGGYLTEDDEKILRQQPDVKLLDQQLSFLRV